MKFDRQYEPAILVYRETRAPGRLLLRRGRLQDGGACSLEESQAVPGGFKFTTHIVSKDTRGLLVRLRKCLEGYTEENDSDIDAITIDYPALRFALEGESGDQMARDLEKLWGAPALETILSLPSITTRAQRRELLIRFATDEGPEKKTTPLPDWLGYALAGIIAIIVLPLVTLYFLMPEKFETTQRSTSSQILEYSKRAIQEENEIQEADIPRKLTEAELARLREKQIVQEKIRSTKQDLYLAADFGPLDETYGVVRSIAPRISNASNTSTTLNSAGGETTDDSTGAADPADSGKPKTDSPQSAEGTGTPENKQHESTQENPETKDSTLPEPNPLVMEMAQYYGFPVDLAGLRLTGIDTYNTTFPETGAPATGATATYDVRRGVQIILQGVPEDLEGLPSASDEVVKQICAVLEMDMDENSSTEALSEPNETAEDRISPADLAPLAEANLTYHVGRSEIAGIAVNQDVCAEKSYRVFTMFEYVPQTDIEDAAEQITPPAAD